VIPQHIVQTILETARIEEVVSDFVRLKKRGSNLIGLCPFHQEKTPSFTVSPSKSIFKCFGCGKSGNAAGFIMEHEHMSYPEALRYLAQKYQIEIEEHEPDPEEIAAFNERERMLNLNSFAQQYFSEVLYKTDEGKAIGLTYFKEREFLEPVIKKFQLGFSPQLRDSFSSHALTHGYASELLLSTGLSIGSTEKLYDRFQSRVIFPIHNLTGKVIGFGARILGSDKSKAKYLNSPESLVYEKSKSLYGIYFAKNAIIRQDNCLLVEGYTDVISMHQAGIEHVVASSGTSLTIEQIRLIKRYTKNITILFDGDPAGIRASMRGIDLILEEGMNVRVVLLPDGEDPDSFARNHRSSEVLEFLSETSKDFVSFKTSLLLEDSKHDPIQKASLIKEIVQTISLIPEPIYREVYVKECSRLLQVEEQTLLNELNKLLRQKFAKQAAVPIADTNLHTKQQEYVVSGPESQTGYFQERELVKILLEFGGNILTQTEIDEDGFPIEQEESVARYIIEDLKADAIEFIHTTHQKILEIITQELKNNHIPDEKFFIHHPEPDVAMLSIDLLSSPYELHNWERKNIFVKKEYSSLQQIVTSNLLRYKDKVIDYRLQQLSEEIKKTSNLEDQLILLEQKRRYDQIRKQINERLGIIISK
jgi:DNA primase